MAAKKTVKTTKPAAKTVDKKTALDFPRGPSLYHIDPDDIWIIGLDTEDGSDDHYGHDVRIDLPVSTGLMEGVEKEGVLVPVMCTKDGKDPVVVDGRQRVKACREVNKKRRELGLKPFTVPVHFKSTSDNEAMRISIMTNELRQQDPVTVKAAKCHRFLKFGGTVAEAAICFGVSRQTIQNWEAIATAPKPLQEAIAEGKITASEVVKNAKKPRKEQLKTVETLEKQIELDQRPKMGRPTGPSRDTVKHVWREVEKNGKGGFVHPEFLKAIKWVLGKIDAQQAGLADIL